MRTTLFSASLILAAVGCLWAQSNPSDDAELKAREERRVTSGKGYHYAHPKNTGATPESAKENKSDKEAKRDRKELDATTPPTYTPQNTKPAAP